MDHKFTIIPYKSINSALERATFGYDTPTKIEKKFSYSAAVEKNLGNFSDNFIVAEHIITFHVSQKLFDQFIQSFIPAKSYRRELLKEKACSLDVFVEMLFEEYMQWLAELKQMTSRSSTWTEKNHLEFLLIYNSRYFPRYMKNSEIKKNITQMNPFIIFWINCNALRQNLRLPVNTIIMPTIIQDGECFAQLVDLIEAEIRLMFD